MGSSASVVAFKQIPHLDELSNIKDSFTPKEIQQLAFNYVSIIDSGQSIPASYEIKYLHKEKAFKTFKDFNTSKSKFRDDDENIKEDEIISAKKVIQKTEPIEYRMEYTEDEMANSITTATFENTPLPGDKNVDKLMKSMW